MSSPPRPILKRTQTAPHHHHAHGFNSHHVVHFPPSPSLTRTFTAHPPSIYDRSPIVVAPNSCALPERGCPGRTYTLDESAPPPSPPLDCPRRGPNLNGRVLHPRALAFSYRGRSLPNAQEDDEDFDNEAQRTPTRLIPVLPSLIPDLSSSESSEESDGFAGPHPQPHYPNIPSSCMSRSRNHSFPSSQGSPDKYPSYTSYEIFNGPSTQDALSFLPHPPSPHSRDDDSSLKSRRRRRERRRERSQSRERDRDRDRVRIEFESRAEDVSTSLKRPSRSGGSKSLSISKAMSSFSFEDPDSGCLGGF